MEALFSFSGRVGRSAYWMSMLAGIFIYGTLLGWMATLDSWEQPQWNTNYYTGESQFYWEPSTDVRVIFILFAIAIVVLFIIGLSVGVRRWHDHGKSGWWTLITLVPFVGGLYALAMLGFVAGTPGPNAFGPPPR